MAKSGSAWDRSAEIYDTTIGWRFPHPKLHETYGTDAMGVTAENVAAEYGISRADQDAFALESHERAVAARDEGRFKDEIVPIEIPSRKGEPGARQAGRTAATRHVTGRSWPRYVLRSRTMGS